MATQKMVTSHDAEDIEKLKDRLHSLGYQAARHSSEKQLRPGEYIEKAFSGSDGQFNDNPGKTIIWIE